METNYGKIEQFVEINEIINDSYAKKQGNNNVYTQKVDKLWFYMDKKGENWTLSVVATFKIIDKIENTSSYGSTTTTSTTSNNFTEKKANLNLEMIYVKGGTYKMGCTSEQTDCDDDEKPAHNVTLNDFYIGKYEVTQAQWYAIMGTKPSDFKDCDNCPVEQVSWDDIQKFLRKLKRKTGKKYRLPTEAEWEYAARGGVKTNGRSYQYSGSNNIDDVAWYWKNSGDEKLSGELNADNFKNNDCKTHNVGTKQENELGSYDMSCNVWELCSDWYDSDYYSNSPQNNPQGASSRVLRVLRGGSWYWSYYSQYCSVANRSYINIYDRDNYIGFRLVYAF